MTHCKRNRTQYLNPKQYNSAVDGEATSGSSDHFGPGPFQPLLKVHFLIPCSKQTLLDETGTIARNSQVEVEK